MLDLSRDIHPLTDFKRNTAEFLSQLKTTGQPVVLTINGKAELSSRTPGPTRGSWNSPNGSRPSRQSRKAWPR